MSSRFSHRAKIGPTPPVCHESPDWETIPGPCNRLPAMPSTIIARVIWSPPATTGGTRYEESTYPLHVNLSTTQWLGNFQANFIMGWVTFLEVQCNPFRYKVTQTLLYIGSGYDWTTGGFISYDGPPTFSATPDLVPTTIAVRPFTPRVTLLGI